MGIELSKVDEGGVARKLTRLVSGDYRRPYERDGSSSEERLAECRACQANSRTRTVWSARRSGKSGWILAGGFSSYVEGANIVLDGGISPFQLR